MATASHDHLPDSSASLSKSHHRAPISDSWGPSLNSKNRSTESSSDYASEIAADSSRGPLMSSASSVHGPLVDEAHNAHSGASIGKDSSSTPLSASASWPTSSPVSNAVPVPGVPSSSAVGSGPVRSVGSGQIGASANTGSGIWGPRQSFSGFSTAPAGFVPNGPSTSTSYPASASASSWMMDGNSSTAPAGAGAAAAAPLGIHGLSPAVSGSQTMPPGGYYVPTGPSSLGTATPMGASMSSNSVSSLGSTSMQKMTPPRSSPSPPHGAMAGMPSVGSRSYMQSAPPVQQPVAVHQQPVHQQHVNHHGGQQQQHHQQQHQHNHGGNQMMMRGQYPHDNQAFMRPFKKNGRPSTNTELYKTELCASYMSTGGNCPYGEKCQFAHGPQELKTVDRPPKWRSKPCQNWVRTGTCSYNERCCFRHDVPVGYDQQQ